MDRDEHLRRLKELEGQRRQWDVQSKDIQDYILTTRGFFSDKQQPNEGEKRQDLVIDGTATRAIRTLAAGMQGGLTSPARPWFRLKLSDDKMMELSAVREYLDECTRRMYQAFGASNFYTIAHQLYTELAGFGAGVIYEEEHFEKIILFKQMTCGEYYLSEGPDEKIDTVYRKFYMQARNIAKKFGLENCSQAIKQANNEKGTPFAFYEVVHVVGPRDEAGKRGDNKGKPWESGYFEYAATEEPKKVLAEGGYDEFPFFCPRWGKAGPDVYGRSPGHDVLPDVKMLQSMTRSLLLALHKQVDPPMMAPESMRGRLNMVPKGVTYTDSMVAEQLKPLYQVQFDVQWTVAQIQQVQKAIREGLFNDLFLMILEKQNMTATEVAERHEEKLLMLGPVIERQFYEFLDPCIDRTYAIMNRAGRLPPPPRELEGMDLNVEYISILAQAQKLVTGQTIRTTADFVIGLGQMIPEVLDKFDADEAVDQYSEVVGAPAKIVRSDEEVEKIRNARAKAQAEALERERQTMEAAQAVDAAKKLSETQTGQSGTALNDLAQSLGA